MVNPGEAARWSVGDGKHPQALAGHSCPRRRWPHLTTARDYGPDEVDLDSEGLLVRRVGRSGYGTQEPPADNGGERPSDNYADNNADRQ